MLYILCLKFTPNQNIQKWHKMAEKCKSRSSNEFWNTKFSWIHNVVMDNLKLWEIQAKYQKLIHCCRFYCVSLMSDFVNYIFAHNTTRERFLKFTISVCGWWQLAGWPSVHSDTTRRPSEYLQGTLEHHWKNLVETTPHWNATGET